MIYVTIYPTQEEFCEGLDSNGDGELLESEIDIDGDGYVECSLAITGWLGDEDVLGGDDCSADNPQISNFSEEICDGMINICGATDTE